jgi:F-type H+-transporting ATPase subunit delta
MQTTAAARRYARALFALATEENSVDATRSALSDLAKLLSESPELEQRIFRPLHPVAERRAVLTEICRVGGAGQTIQNFFAYLIDQRRLVDFPSIRREFGELADAAAGRVRAEVTTASPLRDEQRDRLQRALAHRTGKQVELSVRVDPTLLGGAIASVGGVIFDGSLRSQLAAMRASLLQGATLGNMGEPEARGAD